VDGAPDASGRGDAGPATNVTPRPTRYLADGNPARREASGRILQQLQSDSGDDSDFPNRHAAAPGARLPSPGPGGARRRRVDPHENFENLQVTSKWFPDVYKAPEAGEEVQPPCTPPRCRQHAAGGCDCGREPAAPATAAWAGARGADSPRPRAGRQSKEALESRKRREFWVGPGPAS
jgi:hypothetical protein